MPGDTFSKPKLELKRNPTTLAQKQGRHRAAVACISMDMDYYPFSTYRFLPTVSKESTVYKYTKFWDRDDDGRISVKDTWTGLHELGFSIYSSVPVTLLVHGSLSVPSCLLVRSKVDPFWGVYVGGGVLMGLVQKALIGTGRGRGGIFDFQGRFLPDKFEEMVSSCKSSDPACLALTMSEVFEMVKWRRSPKGPLGWTMVLVEWAVLCSLLREENGTISKNRLRRVYDGTLLWSLQQETNKTKPKKSPTRIDYALDELGRLRHVPDTLISAIRTLIAIIIFIGLAIITTIPCLVYVYLSRDVARDVKAGITMWMLSWVLVSWRTTGYMLKEGEMEVKTLVGRSRVPFFGR